MAPSWARAAKGVASLANETPAGPLPEALERRIHDPLMGAATVLLNALLLGILFLMVVKPALVFSIVAMAVSAGLGLAVSLPFWFGERHVSKTADSA